MRIEFLTAHSHPDCARNCCRSWVIQSRYMVLILFWGSSLNQKHGSLPKMLGPPFNKMSRFVTPLSWNSDSASATVQARLSGWKVDGDWNILGNVTFCSTEKLFCFHIINNCADYPENWDFTLNNAQNEAWIFCKWLDDSCLILKQDTRKSTF